jgi:hypothetical protein
MNPIIAPHDLTPNAARSRGLPPVDIGRMPTLADLSTMVTDRGRNVAQWWIGALEHQCRIALDLVEAGAPRPLDPTLTAAKQRLEAIRALRQEFLRGIS